MLQYITNTTERLKDVLRGGCRWIQLRIKDATDEQLLTKGREVERLCRIYNARFIIDDRVDMVYQLNADGVHLGQNDMPISEARKLLGNNKIVGATANTRHQLYKAVSQGADYIGLGPYRFTTTKKNLSPVLGIEGYRSIMMEKYDVPVVAIGGIAFNDLSVIMSTDVDGVAISSYILNAPDPEETVRSIISIVGV